MTDVSVTFAVGGEQVTVVLPVDLPIGGGYSDIYTDIYDG